MGYTDHATLEAFVRALAIAHSYRSSDLGFEDSIAIYWQQEAEAWVERLDHQEYERRASSQG
jgi:hypothetical protein